MCVLSHFCCIRLFVTLWTIAREAPVHGFSRQEYWSGLPCPPPGVLPDPGIESRSLTSFILAGAFLTTSSTLHVLLSYKDLCSVNQSQGLLKVDENLELRVKWIWTWIPTFVLLWSWEMIRESILLYLQEWGGLGTGRRGRWANGCSEVGMALWSLSPRRPYVCFADITSELPLGRG